LEFSLGRKLKETEVSHHVDHNHLNNNLENLQAEDYRIHVANHRKVEWQNKTESEKEHFRELNSQRMTSEKAQNMSRKFWDNMSDAEFESYREMKRQENLNQSEDVKNYRRKRASEWFNDLPSEEKDRIKLHLENYRRANWLNLSPEERSSKISLEKNPRFKHELNEETVRNALTETGGKIGKTCEKLKIDWRTLDRRLKMYGISREEIRERYIDNHKVLSVEPTGIVVPVYDMTVKNTHNFVANGIVVHNSGATPAEAVSWGKVDPEKLPDAVVCYVDSTVALPIITAYALARHEPREPKRLYERRDEFMKLLQSEYEKSTRR